MCNAHIHVHMFITTLAELGNTQAERVQTMEVDIILYNGDTKSIKDMALGKIPSIRLSERWPFRNRLIVEICATLGKGGAGCQSVNKVFSRAIEVTKSEGQIRWLLVSSAGEPALLFLFRSCHNLSVLSTAGYMLVYNDISLMPLSKSHVNP